MKLLLQLNILLWAALSVCTVGASQNVIKVPVNGKTVSCGLHGSITNHQAIEYTMNPKKNRYDTPSQSDYNTEITLEQLISPSATQDKFTEGQAIELVGYVDTAMVGGTESCNCKTKNPKYRDTHIELVPNPGDNGASCWEIHPITSIEILD